MITLSSRLVGRFFGLLLLLLATRVAAVDPPVPQITVYGTAVIQVQPDLLRWSLEISDRGTALPALAKRHASNTDALFRLLKTLSIPPEDIQSSRMQMSEYGRFVDGKLTTDGFQTSTDVSFVTRHLDDYRKTWLALAEHAGVSIENTTWDTSKRIELQNQARIDALHSAKAKAEQMAGALGATIAEPMLIEEIVAEDALHGHGLESNVVNFESGPDLRQEPAAPGTVSIRSRVRVAFRLVMP
jgi:uncharacterized protein YggE